MARSSSTRRRVTTALLFLGPNILGVLAFVIFPVVFSVALAFTNWDLRLHNMFKSNPLEFVGLDNFIRLFKEPEFFRFLGNTLFLMMGIPFAIIGSLMAAILLSKDTRGGGGKTWLALIAAGVLVASCMMLAAIGMGSTALTIVVVGLACGILLLGMTGGVTVYRTLFYTPHFTAGVATFLLWKKLYNPQTGPINTALQPVLDGLGGIVRATPDGVVAGGFWLALVLIGAIFWFATTKLRQLWIDGELGNRAAILPAVILLMPLFVMWNWERTTGKSWILALIVAAVLIWQFIQARGGREHQPSDAAHGFGNALVLALMLMTLQLVVLGLGTVAWNLPAMAADGLNAPNWLTDVHWAKPALMIMGFWGALGSNNMLLYLAALTNVPQELYEAADMDGASPFQRFWHVTWPQLAPTTFFIGVMATIHGLQGGFEMARTMTQGGPDGATTTLSYFIYIEGFETGRLGFAAAVAWALFVLVFSITLFNWKFGNKYVND